LQKIHALPRAGLATFRAVTAPHFSRPPAVHTRYSLTASPSRRVSLPSSRLTCWSSSRLPPRLPLASMSSEYTRLQQRPRPKTRSAASARPEEATRRRRKERRLDGAMIPGRWQAGGDSRIHACAATRGTLAPRILRRVPLEPREQTGQRASLSGLNRMHRMDTDSSSRSGSISCAFASAHCLCDLRLVFPLQHDHG
jgi:hypothetical protein